MPAAVAISPLPATPATLQPTSLDGAFPSVTGGDDFAALLLGQLSAETLSGKFAADAELIPTQATETPVTSLDPALLLASMGITPPPSVPVPLDRISEPAIDTTTSDPTGLALALPQIPGVAQLPAATDAQSLAGKTISINDRPAQATLISTQKSEPTAQIAASRPETPANLAGFEQKLADAVQAIPEGQPSAQQVASAALLGNNAVSPRHANDSVRIEAPLKDQAWPAEFGQKVVWLATQDKQSAQITLNPPQLGPIEISLSVKSDQATAVFSSANAEVREAIESALPRLREMLAGVGVELGQTNVSAESFRQAFNEGNGNNRNNPDGRGNNGGNGTMVRNETLMTGSSVIKRGNGLVDTFA